MSRAGPRDPLGVQGAPCAATVPPWDIRKSTFFNVLPDSPTDPARIPQGPPRDTPGTRQGLPSEPQAPPREIPGAPADFQGIPQDPPGPLQVPQFSRQSVSGPLIAHVVGSVDPLTSPGVGLGGVTRSGLGSAASAEGLSIFKLPIIVNHEQKLSEQLTRHTWEEARIAEVTDPP